MSCGRHFKTRRKLKGIDKNKMQACITKIETCEGGFVIKEEKYGFHDKRENNKGKGKLLQEEDVLQQEKGEEIDVKGKGIMVEYTGFDGANMATVEYIGFDAENMAVVENRAARAGSLLPSGVKKNLLGAVKGLAIAYLPFLPTSNPR
jgi:hypothetical protein